MNAQQTHKLFQQAKALYLKVEYREKLVRPKLIGYTRYEEATEEYKRLHRIGDRLHARYVRRLTLDYYTQYPERYAEDQQRRIANAC